MNSSWSAAIAVLIVAVGLTLAIGRLLRVRAGLLRGAEAAQNVDTSDLGLSTTGPTIVRFTAPWCGPCAAVRRVVTEVCAELGGVAQLEIDIEAKPELARRFSVLSLPTTLVFDAAGKPRFRTHGVPKAAELKAAVGPLLA
ncbi:MAG: thioredoxin family protein [Mycolicibacterium hassiacum]|jgi:thioredoxin-like negative regulator of GroEL|nr:MAG: thioredoxin [Mycolicibacterium hassiacum]